MAVVVAIANITTKIFTIAQPYQNQKGLKVVFAQHIRGGCVLYHLKVNNHEHTQIGVNMECVKCTSVGSSIITANNDINTTAVLLFRVFHSTSCDPVTVGRVF